MTHILRNEEEAVNSLFVKLSGLMGSNLSMQRPYGYVSGEERKESVKVSQLREGTSSMVQEMRNPSYASNGKES